MPMAANPSACPRCSAEFDCGIDTGACWCAGVTVHAASREAFGQPPGALGIGGSIPFMAMLGHRFPEAQFLVTGVMGPGSNAHGPNEFLDLPTARRVTSCVAGVLDAHARAV